MALLVFCMRRLVLRLVMKALRVLVRLWALLHMVRLVSIMRS